MPDLVHLVQPRPTSSQTTPIPYLVLRPTSYIGNEVDEAVGGTRTNHQTTQPRPVQASTTEPAR